MKESWPKASQRGGVLGSGREREVEGGQLMTRCWLGIRNERADQKSREGQEW